MKLLTLASLLSALGLLSGCAGTPAVIADARPFCAAVTPVCISKDDVLTEETARQIEANNLGRAAICGRPRKCRKGA